MIGEEEPREVANVGRCGVEGMVSAIIVLSVIVVKKKVWKIFTGSKKLSVSLGKHGRQERLMNKLGIYTPA